MISLSDLDIAAKTVWGEARGENVLGRLAVAHVILNRWRHKSGRFGDTISEVCQQKWQFSCWNANDPNRDKMEALTPDSKDYRRAMIAVLEALNSDEDPTYGSTHYHADSVSPKWARGHEPCAIIYHHRFFNDVR